jgi:predicted AAA+ superfamily ATPase
MERALFKDLVRWKDSVHRKPLILEGVRQVGKTWLLKEFGARNYDTVAYFNFDESPELRQFFETTKNPSRIIDNLTLATGQRIKPHTTLIFFDEIQDAPNVINSLKYFYENAPEFHVASAGSLLGIALARPSSFPVGMVDLLRLNPLSFSEFLQADGEANLVAYLGQKASEYPITPFEDAFFNPLTEKLKTYFVTGGMPEPVKLWVEDKDVDLVQGSLAAILALYQRDFNKYPDVSQARKITYVWDSLPSQLARENKKFLYSLVRDGARAREFEEAIQWLVDARLLTKAYRSAKPGIPLSAYDDLSAFKLYLVDVGLMRRQAKLAPSVFAEGNRLFTEFKGALSENYALQSLINQYEVTPRYWATDKPRYEVDFLLQHDNDIIPVEVKSGTVVKSEGLKKYQGLFEKTTKLRIRFSQQNLRQDGNLINIPLFFADFTKKIVTSALGGR